MTQLRQPVSGRRAVVLLSFAVTLACLGVDQLGWFAPLERWLYDKRVEHGQTFTPPPTDQLVHLCIDDRSLYQIGRWPWDRSRLGQIVDVLNDADAKVIAFDILFAEPQRQMVELDDEGKPHTHHPDVLFARAMQKHKRCALPMFLHVPSSMTRVDQHALELLDDNPHLTNDELTDELIKKGVHPNDDHIANWPLFRRSALARHMAKLLERMKDDAAVKEHVVAQHFPHLDATDIDRQFEMALTWRATRDIALRPPQTQGPKAMFGVGPGPVEPLASAADAIGHVSTEFEIDGVNRAVFPWIQVDDRAYLQLGIAMAARQLDVGPEQIELHHDRILLHRPDGRVITIPLSDSHLTRHAGHYTPVLRIPWRGPRNQWTAAYGNPKSSATSKNYSMMYVYRVIEIQSKMEINQQTMHDALLALAEIIYPGLIPQIQQIQKLRNRYPAMASMAKRLIRDYDSLSEFRAVDEIPTDFDPVSRERLRHAILAIDALEKIQQIQPELGKALNERRRELRQVFQGKTVLIGWTASGTVDYHNTPLDSYCPGFMIHSMVFNAVMTDDFWTDAPEWTRFAVPILVGLLLALIWSCFRPVATVVLSFLLLAVLLIVNTVVLFDYANIVMGLACPLTVWMATFALAMVVRLSSRIKVLEREHA